MSVAYKDYYKILGVDRDAGQDVIRKVYRKLAKKFHPDVNKEPGAEQKYKDINEAYEVLKDPEKRQKYDTLGSDWREGDTFTPPPGYGGVHMDFGDEDLGGFSDFFRSVFGGMSGMGNMEDIFFGSARAPRKGRDQEVQLHLSLEEIFQGGRRSIILETREPSPDGRFASSKRTLNVNIPRGVTDGTRLRLSGQGSPGMGGGARGDLYVRIILKAHSRFEVDGYDIRCGLNISPWEAVLGTSVPLETLDGKVSLKIPSGTQSGQTLRLRGKGLYHKNSSNRGDLLVRIQIVVPSEPTNREKALFESLARESGFDPRK
ncbi:MAG: DnaJ domain-containing protein [Synergistales bacterium]|nr:DnaJ domain-containing protein [Synergistales bacterium]